MLLEVLYGGHCCFCKEPGHYDYKEGLKVCKQCGDKIIKDREEKDREEIGVITRFAEFLYKNGGFISMGGDNVPRDTLDDFIAQWKYLDEGDVPQSVEGTALKDDFVRRWSEALRIM